MKTFFKSKDVDTDDCLGDEGSLLKESGQGIRDMILCRFKGL